MKLDISYNLIESFACLKDLHLPKLEALDISNNLLQTLDSIVILNSVSPNLSTLSLANNCIHDLSGLKELNLKKLAHVDLSANKLTLSEDQNLRKLTYMSDALETLDLRGNPAPESYDESAEFDENETIK